jgi:predicted O-linked N-acetylglucosamine transferase (SPINDLY family)
MATQELFEAALRHHQSGRLSEAEQLYRQILQIDSGHADALQLLGVLAHQVGRNDIAVELIGSAIKINGTEAIYHSNLGVAFWSLGQFDEAIVVCCRALLLKPDYADAWNNLGNGLKEVGYNNSAIIAYNAALRINPTLANAYTNLGNVQKDLARHEEAVASYRAAVRCSPEVADVHSNLLMGLSYLNGVGEQTIYEAARDFAARLESNLPDTVFSNKPDPERRLRIGYVSGDFCQHPVGYFLSGVLANHDKAQVEIFCYSNNPKEDGLTAQLRSIVDHWRSVVGMSDQDAANLITADQIDVLIDLAGHTAMNRLSMFALKPAPVQVTWIGCPGTSGLKAMDYILGDRHVAPAPSAPYFTEKLWHLPNSYLCFSPPNLECPVGIPPSAKSGPITFGSFNNNAKNSAFTIELWVRILKSLPESRLFLRSKTFGSEIGRQNMIARFEDRGIVRERLILEGWSQGRGEMLGAYNRIDVALDPTPYGGATTTADALWMGVPVVTLRGETWVGRMSTSVLSTIGLPDLVASSADEYVEIATRLAGDSRRLIDLRSSLRLRVEQDLCDGITFTRDVEHAFRGMWRAWCVSRQTKTPSQFI